MYYFFIKLKVAFFNLSSELVVLDRNDLNYNLTYSYYKGQ